MFVNGKLAAVDNDPCGGHGGGGNLNPIYGQKNIYIEGKLIICAVGDSAKNLDMRFHPPGPVDPLQHSIDVAVYGGFAGGSTTV